MLIYKATFPNNKMYIGKTKDFEKRKSEHKYRKLNTKISRAINKYGYDNVKWDILYECSSLDELNNKEKYFIKLFDSINVGYNISFGGDGGDTISKNENKVNIIKKAIKIKRLHRRLS